MAFFTADQHFYHKNVITYEKRPFKDVDEMTGVMIENNNAIVTDNDDLYIIGDHSFGNPGQITEVLKALKGRKHLIWGNHDSGIKTAHHKYFHSISDYVEIRIDEQKLVLFHYPIIAWNGQGHGSIHLHGHTHYNIKPGQKSEGHRPDVYNVNKINVGVDLWDFKPVSFAQVMAEVERRRAESIMDFGSSMCDSRGCCKTCGQSVTE